MISRSKFPHQKSCLVTKNPVLLFRTHTHPTITHTSHSHIPLTHPTHIHSYMHTHTHPHTHTPLTHTHPTHTPLSHTYLLAGTGDLGLCTYWFRENGSLHYPNTSPPQGAQESWLQGSGGFPHEGASPADVSGVCQASRGLWHEDPCPHQG